MVDFLTHAQICLDIIALMRRMIYKDVFSQYETKRKTLIIAFLYIDIH
jgi:hypothetical protein